MNREKREAQKKAIEAFIPLIQHHPPVPEWTLTTCFNPIAVPMKAVTQEVRTSCTGISSQPNKERNMRTEAQNKMTDRVNNVTHLAVNNMEQEFHLYPDPNPETVQGFLDAMENKTLRLIAGVKPTDKVKSYATVSDYFELRTVDADREGFEKKRNLLNFEAKKTIDAIVAHPTPEGQWAAFQDFLTKWEAPPVAS